MFLGSNPVLKRFGSDHFAAFFSSVSSETCFGEASLALMKAFASLVTSKSVLLFS